MAEKRENNSDDNPPAKPTAFSVVRNDSLDRKREIFYNLTADTQFRMADGIVIRFNKGMLYSYTESEVFFQMLFGPLKDEITTISDITYSVFKLFLDSVMGFTPYTYDTAFTIFPVAWKYQVEKSINDCVDALISNEILNSDKICDVLNVGTMYDCKQLTEKAIDFISKNYTFPRIFENTNYSYILEPRSLVEVLKHIILDSYEVNLLLEWGANYLTRRSSGISVREFFDQYGITDLIKIDHFESVSSLFDFSVSDFGRDMFSADQIKSHLKDSKRIEFSKSEWKKIKAGESIIDEIQVFDMYVINRDVRFRFHLRTSHCFFYDPNVFASSEIKYVEIKLLGNREPDGMEYKNMSKWNDANNNAILSLKEPITYLGDFERRKILKIEYKFHYDCRILLTNKIRHDSNEKLCFTKLIMQQRLN